MKKIILAVVMIAICSAPLMAQIKFDANLHKEKIAKSDADIANAKRSAKASTWIERGKILVEAQGAPTNGVYVGLDAKGATIIFGKSSESQKTIDGVNFKVMRFPNFNAYVNAEGRIDFWEPTKNIGDSLLPTALAAYVRAYELDNGAAKNVKEGIKNIAAAYRIKGDNLYSLRKYPQAADAYKFSYETKLHPAVNEADTTLIYNSGLLYIFGAKFKNAIKSLEEAKKLNYEANGDLYYYLYHSYFSLKDYDKAKAVLNEAIAKYPENEKIVEGFTTLYSTTGENPKEVIDMVEARVAKDPKNASLWSGLGVLYHKLGNMEKSIEAFSKAADLLPGDYNTIFNVGLLYILHGDATNTALNQQQNMPTKEFNAQMDKVNEIYAKSVEPLEKALTIKAGDRASIEYLKGVCFRLRDLPGMMDKYNKYNEMFKALP